MRQCRGRLNPAVQLTTCAVRRSPWTPVVWKSRMSTTPSTIFVNEEHARVLRLQGHDVAVDRLQDGSVSGGGAHVLRQAVLRDDVHLRERATLGGETGRKRRLRVDGRDGSFKP